MIKLFERDMFNIFERPRVQRESAGTIREFVNHVQKYLRVLHEVSHGVLGRINQLYDWKKLGRSNENTMNRWNMREHHDWHWSSFLQCRYQIFERATLNESRKSHKQIKGNHERYEFLLKQKQPFNSKVLSKTSLSTIQGRQCYLCQGQHLIYTCNQFLKLSVAERIQTVNRLKLCIKSAQWSCCCKV